MTDQVQQAQFQALQQAAAQHGASMPMVYGDNLSTGARFILKQAEVRGVVVHSINDITQQAIVTIAECMVVAATAFANGALTLSDINQQVQGTEYGAMVRQFNTSLLQQFGTQVHTILDGSGR